MEQSGSKLTFQNAFTQIYISAYGQFVLFFLYCEALISEFETLPVIHSRIIKKICISFLVRENKDIFSIVLLPLCLNILALIQTSSWDDQCPISAYLSYSKSSGPSGILLHKWIVCLFTKHRFSQVSNKTVNC